jgi:hypothetical protein
VPHATRQVMKSSEMRIWIVMLRRQGQAEIFSATSRAEERQAFAHASAPDFAPEGN